jgi:hypothetical protein
MVVLANFYMAGLLSVPGCATTIYLAGLAICTWLCYNFLLVWAGFLYLAVLAPSTLRIPEVNKRISCETGLCSLSIRFEVQKKFKRKGRTLAGTPLPGWAGFLYLECADTPLPS